MFVLVVWSASALGLHLITCTSPLKVQCLSTVVKCSEQSLPKFILTSSASFSPASGSAGFWMLICDLGAGFSHTFHWRSSWNGSQNSRSHWRSTGPGHSSSDGAQFEDTFALATPTNERKRQLGTPARWAPHRQAGSGSNSVRSRFQMKRGVVPPLFF